MEWTHIACMAAGGLLGSFLMTVWQNERRYRREPDFTVPVRLADGWWFPPATQPPPPAPPAPPAPHSRPPETR